MNTEVQNKKKGMLNRMPLKKKLVLSYLVLTMIPILVIGFFVMHTFTRTMKEKISYSAEQGFSQTYDFLAYRFTKAAATLDRYANSSMIRGILLKDPKEYGIVEQVSDMIDIRESFEDAKNGEDVDRVRIYVRDELVYSIDGIHMFGLQSIEEAPWYRYLQEDEDQILGCPFSWLTAAEADEKEILSFARAVKSPNNYREIIGYLRVDMDKANVEEILKKADAAEDAVTYIRNSRGELVASSKSGLFLQVPQEAQTEFKKAVIDGEDMLYRTQEFANLDWTMVTIIPYSSFMKEISLLEGRFLICVLLFSVLVSALIFLIGKSITDRVELLAGHMKKVQGGELAVLTQDGGSDEIGILYDNFNYMIEETKGLLEEKYRLGKEVKSAELKALQSQINPHFLYNTLDMIKWFCYSGRTADIEKVVTSMAKFYKITLSRGKNIVTVKEELDHSREYVNIQNFRFGNKIDLRIEVPESLMEVPIPKITLQPLLENAILHGILEKEEESGTITVRGREDEHDVSLVVRDDGVGMSREQMSAILAGEEGSKKGSSYGIINIQQRIRLLYGGESGLVYKSSPGEGTEVTIQLFRGGGLPGQEK